MILRRSRYTPSQETQMRGEGLLPSREMANGECGSAGRGWVPPSSLTAAPAVRVAIRPPQAAAVRAGEQL